MVWQLYKKQPGFVLGFHGCDESLGKKVIAGKAHLQPSGNKHDWLGDGIYFWESSPQRALQWAHDAMARPETTKGKIKKPFVVGAIIDLGNCCSLFDADALAELREAHEVLQIAHDIEGTPMPTNKGGQPDYALRYLDCAVIELMHEIREESNLPRYDTVRAAFGEGEALYAGTNLTAKHHIQIAVRDPECIKGYFLPIQRKG